tara:strand:- start:4778 stop:5014 length:237 start_codon:yes stop_codon:yes gene_type:complete
MVFGACKRMAHDTIRAEKRHTMVTYMPVNLAKQVFLAFGKKRCSVHQRAVLQVRRSPVAKENEVSLYCIPNSRDAILL